MRLQAGQTFAGYRVLKQLGRGGMAYVYLVEEPGIDRRVALKLLPEDVVGDRNAEARFEQEAKTVAALPHPNIVPLYRYGIERGAPWMALLYVEGGDLAERLNRPLAVAEGLRCFRQIAAALDFAHQRQVVHRDLKPQNVLLSRDGHVYLADFGIAKLLAGGGIRTGTGGILGTPQYMAPEYARGEVPGPSSDIYALGVIAFQWQTGCLPFDADTPQAVLFKQVLEPLPEAPLQGLPPRVVAVLRKVLDKDPAQRHATAGAFVEALSAALMPTATGGGPGPASKPTVPVDPAQRFPPPVSPRVSDRPAARASRTGLYGGIAAVLIAAGLLWLNWSPKPTPEDGSRPVAPGPAAPAPALSPAPAPSPAAPAKTSDGLLLVRRGEPLPEVGVLFRHALRSGGEGPVMVGVPGGSYLMGSPESEADRDSDEGPPRQVTLPGFGAGKYEVTVSEFRRFVDATKHKTDAEADVDVPDDLAEAYKGPNPGCYVFQESGQWAWEAGREWRSPGLAGSGDQHPVVCVSWNDAQAYVRWLAQETGAGYRLPSEAEQEWMLRGGREGQRFGWGSEASEACRYGNVAGEEGAPHGGSWNPAVPCNDGSQGLSAVGRYASQAFGLHDVLGNALEWSADCYGSYAGARTDGGAVEAPNCRARVLRGASWGNLPAWLRSANRNRNAPSFRLNSIGFRLALDR